ncbi:MAG: M55 family metallopeptidase [Terriglobia bacterium]
MTRWTVRILCLALLIFVAVGAQAATKKKIFMITDMEGVSGIFDSDQQCMPYQSARWEESHKLLTGEVNAAVDGLFEGGATEVVVWDGHDASRSLSVLDINPKARLLTGTPVPSTMELDGTYSAIIFIGQHAMAGAEKGILSHSYSSQGVQNIWVNGKPVGEIGARVMFAGYMNVPAIMLSGDTAACAEIRDLVAEVECAEVKSGVSRTAGYMLPHPVACALIREKARRAVERLTEFKPYKLAGPVEVKVEFTPRGTPDIERRDGIERINDRLWVFRGKDIVEAWLKYSSF